MQEYTTESYKGVVCRILAWQHQLVHRTKLQTKKMKGIRRCSAHPGRGKFFFFFVLNLVHGSEVAMGTQRVWVESPQQGNSEHSIGGCKYLVIEVRAMQDDVWRLKTFQVGGADSLWILGGMEAYLYNGVLSFMWVMEVTNFVHPVEANWKPIEDLSESVAKVISSFGDSWVSYRTSVFIGFFSRR